MEKAASLLNRTNGDISEGISRDEVHITEFRAIGNRKLSDDLEESPSVTWLASWNFREIDIMEIRTHV